MCAKLTEQERLDIENQLLRDMAWRYARLIEKEKQEMAAAQRTESANESRKPETVRIMMTVNGRLSHQRKGLVLDARIGAGRDNKPVYWIHWAGNSFAVDESECVRLDEGGTPIPK